MAIMPFKQDTGYTPFHNYIIDTIMPRLSPNAWKVLCLIIRKTKGWHKDEDAISYSQIMNGAGIKSRSTVSAALEELTSNGYVLAVTHGRTANSYRLNQEYRAPDVSSTEIEQSNICTASGTESGLLVVQKMDTQKKGSKKERKIAPRDAAASDEMKISKHPLTLKVAEICRIDQATATHETKQQLYQSTKILIEQGCTVEEARAAALDWFTHDWRAGAKSLPIRQKNPPTPAQLRERVGSMRVAAKSDELDAARVARDERNRETDAQIEKLKQTPVMTPEQAREWRKSMFAMTGD